MDPGVSAPKDVVVDRQEVHERRKDFAKERPTLPPLGATSVIGTTPVNGVLAR